MLKDNPNVFGLVTKMTEHTEPEQPKRLLITARKLLLEAQSEEVVKKVIELALTNGHPVQGAALKMCMDRMLPISEFEEGLVGGIKTVIIDRSCGGKVIIKTGGSTVEMDTQEYLADTFENDE